MNTMTHEQALEVLKAQKILAPTEQLYTAITIAIECMDNRKFDIMKAFEEGRNSVIDDRMDIKTCNQYYNSLTAPAGDGDEKP